MTDVDDYREPGDDREPDPGDYEEAMAREEHCIEVHDGKECDCPLPSPEEIKAAWAERAREHRAEAHGGGDCDCTAPF